jgi:hypothetical protein
MHDLTSLFCEELLLRSVECIKLSFKLRACLGQYYIAVAEDRERMAKWLATHHSLEEPRQRNGEINQKGEE